MVLPGFWIPVTCHTLIHLSVRRLDMYKDWDGVTGVLNTCHLWHVNTPQCQKTRHVQGLRWCYRGFEYRCHTLIHLSARWLDMYKDWDETEMVLLGFWIPVTCHTLIHLCVRRLDMYKDWDGVTEVLNTCHLSHVNTPQCQKTRHVQGLRWCYRGFEYLSPVTR